MGVVLEPAGEVFVGSGATLVGQFFVNDPPLRVSLDGKVISLLEAVHPP